MTDDFNTMAREVMGRRKAAAAAPDAPTATQQRTGLSDAARAAGAQYVHEWRAAGGTGLPPSLCASDPNEPGIPAGTAAARERIVAWINGLDAAVIAAAMRAAPPPAGSGGAGAIGVAPGASVIEVGREACAEWLAERGIARGAAGGRYDGTLRVSYLPHASVHTGDWILTPDRKVARATYGASALGPIVTVQPA